MKVKRSFKGAYQERGKSVTLFLERQGVSQTLLCAHPDFFVEVAPNKHRVAYSNDKEKHGNNAGQTFRDGVTCVTLPQAIINAKQDILSITKGAITSVDISDQVVAYCHSRSRSYDYEHSDRFLLPIRLDGDHIAASFGGEPIAKFGETYRDVEILDDLYQPHIERALGIGFHECDEKYGDSHCRQRLVWLAGEYAAKALQDSVECEWVGWDLGRA